MAAPQKKAEHFKQVKDSPVEHMNSIQSSIEKLLSFSKDDTTETEMMQSRINEQSSLIGILKQRQRSEASKTNEEVKHLTEKYTKEEKEYRVKLADCQTKILEQTTQHQAKEASLLDQLHHAQQQQKYALEMCKDLKRKMQKAEEEHVLKEIKMNENITRLTKEKDKFLSLSMERGMMMQEKQEEIQQFLKKLEDEKKARIEAQQRFEQEAEAVNADIKVKSLQSALEESMTKYNKLTMDFEAFKEHSANLLKQERELNKKLRHFTG
ncbi:hypothetical protein Q5P01_013507 [Channa striata]|uniref:Uncharacterized protein n=1 Tax=Channa striata TaxID=64152 RepID=A0AA88MMM5_CHASR|nr:hypothetical protein Q5P01_013507 [Channa striata]